jgi:hypothetical protein
MKGREICNIQDRIGSFVHDASTSGEGRIWKSLACTECFCSDTVANLY